MLLASVLLQVFLINVDFPISTEVDYQMYPTPIMANNQYYVFWPDFRYTPLNVFPLVGARVSSAGTVLDPAGKMLLMDTCKYKVNAAYDGTNFLVVLRNGC